MDALLADGDRDAVVELLFRELEDLSDEDMDAFKAAPSWAGRVAAAYTITREIRGELTARLDPACRGHYGAGALGHRREQFRSVQSGR
jgi:hypothetical protein